MYRHGLVIGKFYPPHIGHSALIDFASERCEYVTVIVMGSDVESIPVSDRVRWLSLEVGRNVNVQGVMCEAPVDYNSDNAWRAQTFAMDTVLARRPVNAVFSSEPYGDRLAKHFNAVHVPFSREVIKLSATDIRNDPDYNWKYMLPSARAGLTTRVVFLGSESTGTTTMSQRVYRRYAALYEDVQWVEEFGRKFTIDKLKVAGTKDMADLVWTKEDFKTISYLQQAKEDFAALSAAPLVICDTDAVATQIWETRYLGSSNNYTPARGKRLYFLTDHEGVPFVQDGIRDGEHMRERMTRWFADELTARGLPWMLLTGTADDRYLTAINTIDRILEKNLTFNNPLEKS
jgi:HTH-type transcriptional regulator, transcriptional repressor of NAD biosynthesis genes